MDINKEFLCLKKRIYYFKMKGKWVSIEKKGGFPSKLAVKRPQTIAIIQLLLGNEVFFLFDHFFLILYELEQLIALLFQ